MQDFKEGDAPNVGGGSFLEGRTKFYYKAMTFNLGNFSKVCNKVIKILKIMENISENGKFSQTLHFCARSLEK